MSLLCNPVVWQHQHTYAHHSFTNEFDNDPDLHHFTLLLRVHRGFRRANVHSYQRNWYFVGFAYLLVVFGECVWIPWGMIQEGTLYGMVQWTDRPRRAVVMSLHLSLYVLTILILPFWVHESTGMALISIVAHVSVSGLLFGLFSQINHINERSMAAATKTTKSWAVRQVETSNNYCPDSRFAFLLSNGLNLQIEHHLFPGLNHCHLRTIQPTVQEVCREFKVSYKSYGSWREVFGATLDWLDRLADEDEQR